MITKIARNDVVRLTRTGEVGVVKGWADHESLAANGTILDVEIGRGQTVQANGLALEFVADAKFKISQAVAWPIIAVAGSASAYIGYTLSDTVNAVTAAVVGGLAYPGFDRLLVRIFVKPRKTRLTLPKQTRAQAEAEVNYATRRKL